MGEAASLDELVADLQRELEGQLSANGWKVEAGVGEHAPRFWVSFWHPLSSDASVSFDSEKDWRRSLERLLQRPEFKIIESAPREIPHTRLIRAIRQNAKGFEWPPSVVERLALILGGEGVLTPDEANWLDKAGPAWPLGVHR